MIRIQHVAGSLAGKSLQSARTLIRVGRSPDCEVRFDPLLEPKVSSHHAELMMENGGWFIVDVGSTNGTLVAGRKVRKCKLNLGDEIQIGVGGPVIRVEFDAPGRPVSNKTEAVSLAQVMRTEQHNINDLVPQKKFDDTVEMASISDQLKEHADTQTANLAELAAKKVAEARAEAGGLSSGKTMMIMASTLQQVQQGTKAKTKKRWVKVVAIVAGAALVATGIMGVVIFQQQRTIDGLLSKKDKIDKDILAIQKQMENETDIDKLDALEQKLDALTAKEESTLNQLAKADKDKAQAAADSGDQLDKDIRVILGKFDATTYAVPPIFKQSLQEHIDELKSSSNLKFIYHRKQKYWPVILSEFKALGLPEEMAYIAWAETQFDPNAKSGAGAAGLWQLTASTARSFDLRVDDKVDERFDAAKETHAAARYLANLLAEFGSDSFMLAMASYNRGEAGVRRVLHQIAQEPGGFRKEKRDFWHLYRMKKLPEETREYVPRVIAAAIVCSNPKRYGLEGGDE